MMVWNFQKVWSVRDFLRMTSQQRAKPVGHHVLWLVTLLLVQQASAASPDLSNQVMDITYQSGDTALLPCDISNVNQGDRVTLLLWYKEDRLGGKGSPIYRIDARTTQDLMISHHSKVPIMDWVNEDLLGKNRVSFDTQLSPASLKIRNISEADAGLYRCRVDFTTSQTRTERISLRVIVRPGRPQIFDDTGTVRDIFAGPYLEGSDVHLSCKVVGGKPAPRVVWYKNFQLLSEQYIQEEDPHSHQLVTYNNLTLHAIPRYDLHSNITCEASNYNNSRQQKTITLDMNFLPMKIEVTGKTERLLAGNPHTFTCKAFGSRPPAILTWWLGNQRIDGTNAGNVYRPASEDGTSSTSTLTITPRESDTNSTLTCRAANPEIQQGVLKDSWQLDVHYPPKLMLDISAMLQKKEVAEGQDVFFVCNIESNPPIDRMVYWYHNGVQLKQNPKKRIIMNSSGTNLALQEVSKEANGNYTCRATNGVPEVGHYVESKPFNLDVKYLPVCVPEGVKVYGVAKEEKVKIKCQVAANPANLTFRWTFNNSAEIKDVMEEKYESNGTVSLFSYKPERELDYGTLMCWSRNAIGEQQKPCVFHIIAAGKPDPVKNCSIANVTSSSFQVACSPGFNGGLPQNFSIVVVENDMNSLGPGEQVEPVFQQGDRQDPSFAVNGLKDSTEYRVYVTAVNMKGEGDPQDPQGTLVRTNAEPKPLIEDPKNDANGKNGASNGDSDTLNPILVVIFGGAAGLVLILVTITLAVRVKCSGRNNNRNGGGGSNRMSRENSKIVVTTITDMEVADGSPTEAECIQQHQDRICAKDSSSYGAVPVPSYLEAASGHHQQKHILIQHSNRQQAAAQFLPTFKTSPTSSSTENLLTERQPQPPDNEMRRMSSDFPQPDNYQYLMYRPGHGNSGSNKAAASGYCTMRKHNPLSVQFSLDAGNDDQLGRHGSGVQQHHHRQMMPASQPELGPGDPLQSDAGMADYCEKQRAGLMYGTLMRHHNPAMRQAAPHAEHHSGSVVGVSGAAAHHHHLPADVGSSSGASGPGFGAANYPAGVMAAHMGDDDHACAVVPPPPMFEEGGGITNGQQGNAASVTVSVKTPLLGKKGAKGEKKDKMESRV